MAKTDFKSVDEFIASRPEGERPVLEKFRSTIRAALPEAEEVISYQLPAYKQNGYVIYFAAYDRHYSISCPPPFTVFEHFAERLRPYKKSVSTVQFQKTEPIPFDLIAAMAKYKASENATKKK